MWKVEFVLIILCFFVDGLKSDDEGVCDHEVGFTCTDGFVIDCLDVCDGKKDCPDGSDEFLGNDTTKTPCRKQNCPDDYAKCHYGACISIRDMCDNSSFNCADRSDEWKYYCNIHPENPEKLKSCESGDFIPANKFCNGKIDCLYDDTDESPFLCHLMKCPGRKYIRCKSGGCIHRDKKCDNIKDCSDNSDEEECESEEEDQNFITTNEGCAIRPDPNYYITNGNENYNMNSGDRVPVNTRIIIKCKNNFFFRENKSKIYRICTKDGWDHSLPHCIKYCDARILHNSSSTEAECSFRNSIVDCNQIVPGTTAKVKCADSYKMPRKLRELASYEMTCTSKGNWKERKIHCEPVCGSQESFFDASASEAPWHVGVKTYLNEKCGGTIVSPRMVITALHCVQDEDDVTHNPDKIFVIIAGDLKNGHTQIVTVNVSEIIGGGPIDVALLKLSEILTLSKNIRPICITEREYIVESNRAFLHGWPKDKSKFTDVFHRTELQVLPRVNCSANLNRTYICVRPTYQLERNETLCEGHSGSGIIVENNDGNYIIGILSFKPSRTINCTNEPLVAILFNQIPESLKTNIKSDKEDTYGWMDGNLGN